MSTAGATGHCIADADAHKVNDSKGLTSVPYRNILDQLLSRRGKVRLSSSTLFSLLSRTGTILAVTLGVIWYSQPAHAQLSTASVTGVVRDQSGSVVSGARLTLTNLDTSVKQQSVSNSAGNYLFLSIPPGNYSMDATAPSFQLWKLPSITLAVNQTATVDVGLQLGSLTQTVTVEAAGELLQQSSAGNRRGRRG